MVTCSECGTELAKLRAQDHEGKIREIYTHPPSWPQPCQYQLDGVTVTVRIDDEIILNKFQEFAKSCVDQEKYDQKKIQPVTVPTAEPTGLLVPAKKRLCAGELSIADYKQIKELMKDDI